jgi:hypothetical protein
MALGRLAVGWSGVGLRAWPTACHVELDVRGATSSRDFHSRMATVIWMCTPRHLVRDDYF